MQINWLFSILLVHWFLAGRFELTSPFKRQPHKIVKPTQIIRRLLPTNCLSVIDHFVGLALKGLITGLVDH